MRFEFNKIVKSKTYVNGDDTSRPCYRLLYRVDQQPRSTVIYRITTIVDPNSDRPTTQDIANTLQMWVCPFNRQFSSAQLSAAIIRIVNHNKGLFKCHVK